MKKVTKYLVLISLIMIISLLPKGSAWSAEAKLAENITCKETYDMIQKNSKVILLDVRTQPEFQFVGYIAGAFNIPYWLMSSKFIEKGKEFAFAPDITQKAPMSRYQFTKNPDFMTYVNKLAKPSDKIIVYCGSSKRSAKAADDLVKAGYENVYNMLKGFSKGYVKENLPSEKMFEVETIDPKYIYPPDVSK